MNGADREAGTMIIKRSFGQLKYSRWFTVVKIVFLALTPVAFRIFNFAFIFHSIFWAAITWAVLWWGALILVSFFYGRIGCGWICPFGTLFDWTSPYAKYDIRQARPVWILRILNLVVFLGAASTALYFNARHGHVHGLKFAPLFLDQAFDGHYKLVWMLDVIGIVIAGLIIGRRWWCRNTCFVGFLCAAASKFQRHVIVADKTKCTSCTKCELACPGGVRIMDYIHDQNGLIADTECLKCGKCLEVCKPKALRYKIVWNRKAYIGNQLP